ncbi:hypothetical protein I302_100971 [Kwoniella bestiolae CBS 10118]
MEQVEGLVEKIRVMTEERWDEVQLLIEVEDEVKVAYMRMDDFAWRFTLNELPSGQSISFLTRHLLHPLTVLIATDRSIPLPPSSLTPAESSSRLISDPEIMRAIRRATSKPKPPSHARSSSQQIPSSSNGIEGSPTPRKPPPKRVRKATPTPQSSSSMPPSSPPKLRPTSSIPPESSPPPPPPAYSSSQHPKSKIDQSSSPSAGSAMDFKPPTQRTKREREQEEEELFEKRKKDLQKKMDKGGVGKLGRRRLAR